MKALNDRQRRFAQLVVSGRPAGRAYEEAGYDARGASADSAAERLMRSVEVAGLIEELRAENRKASKLEAADILKFYAEIMQAKPSEAGPDNPLCEVRMSKQGPYYAFPCKHKAAEGIRKMCGMDQAEKVDVGVTDELAELMREIRARKTT